MVAPGLLLSWRLNSLLKIPCRKHEDDDKVCTDRASFAGHAKTSGGIDTAWVSGPLTQQVYDVLFKFQDTIRMPSFILQKSPEVPNSAGSLPVASSKPRDVSGLGYTSLHNSARSRNDLYRIRAVLFFNGCKAVRGMAGTSKGARSMPTTRDLVLLSPWVVGRREGPGETAQTAQYSREASE